jgi:hypothetical protein
MSAKAIVGVPRRERSINWPICTSAGAARTDVDLNQTRSIWRIAGRCGARVQTTAAALAVRAASIAPTPQTLTGQM